MKYHDLKKALNDFTIFSVKEVRKADPRFHRRRLNEWQERDLIKKVVRGYYIFSDAKVDENTLFEIANRIYSPSYVSFEMALARYQLIPESVYGITSASTRKTYRFRTPIADFIYRTIHPRLFFGYDLIRHTGRSFKIASPEKALLDFFYLHPNIKQEKDFESLRINGDVFREQVDAEKLNDFLIRFSQKRLTKRIERFLEYMRHA